LKGGGKSKEEALEMAIRYCIEQDILKDVLKAHASEVINMLLEEWKIDEAKEVWQEEGRVEKALEDTKNFLALG
jgi:hypothetical protein